VGPAWQDYRYTEPPGPNAAIAGLAVQLYRGASDLVESLVASRFVQGSSRIEGERLRAIDLLAPWPYASDSPPPDVDELGADVLAAMLDDEVALVEQVLVYGGAYEDGSFEAGLWQGVVFEDNSEVLWVGPIVPQSGDVPLGRAAGVLLGSPATTDEVVLFGGESAAGLLNDLWSFSAGAQIWTELTPAGDVPSPRAEVAAAQSTDQQRAYLFGGMVGGGLSNELYALDLRTMGFERLEAEGGRPAPEPRQEASLELDEAGNRLLLYGGMGAAGARNDLWAFDLTRRVWERLSPQCDAGGVCPPLASNTVATFDDWSGRLRVVLGQSEAAHEQPTWSYSQGEGWTHTGSIAEQRDRDCDGDGEPEPDYGLLCRATAEWWGALGAMRCAAGRLACAAATVSESAVHDVTIPGAQESALIGHVAVVLTQRRVESVGLEDLEAPELGGRALLSGNASDMAVRGRLAFVAADLGIDVVDLTVPMEPAVVGRVTLEEQPIAVATVGDHTVVASARKGLAVVDVSDPAAPAQVAFLWLRRIGSADWEAALDEGFGPPWRWRSPGASPRPLLSRGHHAVMGVDGELVVFDLSEPTAPALVTAVALEQSVAGLRGHAAYLYTAGLPSSDTGLVVDLRDPEAPEVVGEHAVVEWVRGVLFQDGLAIRTWPRGLEIVELER
jgi:hypothetical protein